MGRHSPILAPSLLAGDHARLAESAARVSSCGLTWLHVDIMDAHFVPNLTFGPETMAALRRAGCDLYFDTHLMLDNPADYLAPFAKAGANNISVHIEPRFDHAAILAQIQKLGCGRGLVLNPDTPADAIEPYLDQVDLVLVMTVQPGFGGQTFRDDMVPKLRVIDQWRRQRKLNFRLEVDGGIDLERARICRAAGADTFVAGTAFFKAADKPALAADFAKL
ncbi:MAG TPA: ribulose-phosphate 3-epimerase [Candidatus Didemnitutus sp.]|nr:ribulose-phosphate 3-epimerase [Candidatus Didemnitutus sp.]